MTTPPELERLRQEAGGETALRGVGLTDPRSMLEMVWPDFTSQLAPGAQLEYSQDVSPRRVAAVLADGGAPMDFVIVGNPSLLDGEGLLQPFDQPHRHLYPEGWVDADARWLPLYVQPTVVVFNRIRVGLPPPTWESLVGEAPSIVFDAPWRMVTAGPTFAELRSVMGDEAWTAWLTALGNGRPRVVADNERAVLEVATGRCQVGLSIWNVARRVRPGSPVGHTFLDPTPCVPGFAALSKTSPNSRLARLFLAWLGSPDGQRSYARTGRVPALPDVDAATALSRVLPSHVEAVYGTTDWLGDPQPYVHLYRELFPEPAEGLAEGKLR